jgi:hypothetical protein
MSTDGGYSKDGKHYWLTPPKLYAELDAEFHFDFDPCPYPRPEGFDGLTCEWGWSNYVNPPFDKTSAWVGKLLAEAKKGRTSVFCCPATRAWQFYRLIEGGATVRAMGRPRFLAIEDGTPHPAPQPLLIFVVRGRT